MCVHLCDTQLSGRSYMGQTDLLVPHCIKNQRKNNKRTFVLFRVSCFESNLPFLKKAKFIRVWHLQTRQWSSD